MPSTDNELANKAYVNSRMDEVGIRDGLGYGGGGGELE